MSRWDNDDEEEDDDEDIPWDADEPATVVCPYCRAEVLEDLPQCPKCGNYFSQEDSVTQTKPPWVVITAVLLLVVFLMFVLRF